MPYLWFSRKMMCFGREYNKKGMVCRLANVSEEAGVVVGLISGWGGRPLGPPLRVLLGFPHPIRHPFRNRDGGGVGVGSDYVGHY